MNKLVKVWPNITDDNPDDDLLTVRFDKHDGTWAGKLLRGQIFRAIESYSIPTDTGEIIYYRLEEYKTKFPFVRTPTNREVWGNSKYLVDYTEGETPIPEPLPIERSLEGLLKALANTILEYYK